MKIVIDARTLGSKPSGIGIYAFNYIKELINSKHNIVLLTDVETSGEMQYLKAQNVEIISYGISVYRSAQVFKYFAFVKEQLVKIQPELFWEPNILIPVNLSGYNGKIMITIHDMFPVTHTQYFGWKYGLYFRIMLKRTIKIADVVLYDSIETKEAAEKFAPELKNKKTHIQYVIVPKIQKINNVFEKSVETDLVENSAQEFFLYVGNMEKRKGVDLLIEAYDKYRENGGCKALVLAGKSREEDVDKKLEWITQKYAEVTYYGYVSDTKKQELYEKCTCFLFPSMAEGFGICVLEAMNFYKPVIASDLTIFREIVGDSINYFSLEGGRNMQIDNLCKKMMDYESAVDEKVYDEMMERYLPERLGQKIVDILGGV